MLPVATQSEPNSGKFSGSTIWWFLALAWAINMFWLSTERFASNDTRPLLAQLLALVHIHLAPPVFTFIHTITRKLAHVGEYAILAILLYRCTGSARATLIACIAFALTDEFHQSFVRSRGPSLIDCAIDTTGALLGNEIVGRTSVRAGLQSR